MSEISIKEFGYRSTCDIRRCSERAEYSIGVDGESAAFNQNFCETHLKQLAKLLFQKFPEACTAACESTDAFAQFEEPAVIELDSILLATDEQTELQQPEPVEIVEPLTQQPKPISSSEISELAKMSRPKLIKLAAELGVKGKITTMKSTELIRKIREAKIK